MGGNVGQSILMNTPMVNNDLKLLAFVKTSHYSGYVAFMDQVYLNDDFGWKNSFDLLLSLNNKADDSIRDQLWSDFGEHISKVQTVEDEMNPLHPPFPV